MRRPARPTPSFASSLFLAIALAGCANERAVPFAQGEEIPLRVLSLRVADWETVPPSLPYLSPQRPPEGEKAIAVFVRWEGLEDYSPLDRRIFVESFLGHRLTLSDSDGYAYEAITAMPRDLYYGSSHDLDAPPDWVAIFHVWIDSGGYSLRVRHPDPGSEDFDVAVVELG